MRIRSLLAAFAASNLMMICGWNVASAQFPPAGGVRPAAGAPTAQPPAAAPRAGGSETSVVVIDVSEVFKNHERFKAAMDQIKEEVKKLEGIAQAEQKAMLKKQEQLRELNPGSPEYKVKEEELARAGSDLQVSMALKQKEIMEREAKVYYNTYMEVQDLVKDFAERNGIRLVLRYTRSEMDPTKRDTVLQGVNRPIVYQHKLDITDLIVSKVNQGNSPAAGGIPTARGGAGPIIPTGPRR